MTSFRNWIRYYEKKYSLTVSVLGLNDGWRIKNKEGLYVDYWKTGSYRMIDGKYFRVGRSHRGFGDDETYDYTNAPIKEIKKLWCKVVH